MSGLLWSITNPHADLATIILQAADCYQRRFSVRPTVAWIHPTLTDSHCQVDGVKIKITKKVPKNYVLIGIV